MSFYRRDYLLIAPVWNRNRNRLTLRLIFGLLLIAPVWNRNVGRTLTYQSRRIPFNRTSLE